MTEREKIIKVIDEWANKAVKANKFDGASVYNPHNAAELADALIAAGLTFGNKHRVLVENAPIPTDYIGNEWFLIPNTPPTIKQLYGDEEVEQIVKERDTYKRALKLAEELGELCAPASNYIQQAEKELQEEKNG